MTAVLDVLLVLVVLTDLALLGTGRLTSSIRQIAIQGMAMGALPLFIAAIQFEPGLVVIGLVSFCMKGFFFPWLLFRSLRVAGVSHEVRPIVGYPGSILFGVGILLLSSWMGNALVLPKRIPMFSDLLMPVALATLFCGLFLIVTRRQALMQVIGYIALENGIYVCGVGMAYNEPLLVEMGVLLDIFVGVFVFGIAIFHISREFDHIDVDQLSELKY